MLRSHGLRSRTLRNGLLCPHTQIIPTRRTFSSFTCLLNSQLDGADAAKDAPSEGTSPAEKASVDRQAQKNEQGAGQEAVTAPAATTSDESSISKALFNAISIWRTNPEENESTGKVPPMPEPVKPRAKLRSKLSSLRKSMDMIRKSIANIDEKSESPSEKGTTTTEETNTMKSEKAKSTAKRASKPKSSKSVKSRDKSRLVKRTVVGRNRGSAASKKSIISRYATGNEHRESTEDVDDQDADPMQHIAAKSLVAQDVKMTVIDTEQPPVKNLSYDLQRVLFKQGVYNLQDPRTGVYNFDHYLQKIVPREDFDFDSLAGFISSSQDENLQNLAKKHGKQYVGSTSSMTSILTHFHYLLSNFRPINMRNISTSYGSPLTSFTEFQRIPSSMYLKYLDGVYAIDADKEYDEPTVLSSLGQSLEKLLTVPKEVFEQYRKSTPGNVPDETKNAPEAYHYSSIGNFLFRSQLDGHHDWLPGTGVFDIKTRACVSIRMNQAEYEDMSGYQIKGLHGYWESYEREYVDMLRSTMLKYSLQVRMGRMDGIFVAYHNTDQIFGFQYIPLSEMDRAMHGQEDLALGDQEFKLSVQMFSDVLDLATKQYPKQSLRLVFETQASRGPPTMRIYAHPISDDEIAHQKRAAAVAAMKAAKRDLLNSSSSQATEEVASVETLVEDEIAGTKEHVDAALDSIEDEDTDLETPLQTVDAADQLEMDDGLEENLSSPDQTSAAPIPQAADTDNGIVVEASPEETENASEEDDIQELITEHEDPQNPKDLENSTSITLSDQQDPSKIRPTDDAKGHSCSEIASDPALPMPVMQQALDMQLAEVVQNSSLERNLEAGLKNDESILDTRDMASRYPAAATIFFPDATAAAALYPLLAAVSLDKALAEPAARRLGCPSSVMSAAALDQQLLIEAEQSQDRLDLVAAKLHVLIGNFWDDPVVGGGLGTIVSFYNSLDYFTGINLDTKEALKFFRNDGVKSISESSAIISTENMRAQLSVQQQRLLCLRLLYYFNSATFDSVERLAWKANKRLRQRDRLLIGARFLAALQLHQNPLLYGPMLPWASDRSLRKEHLVSATGPLIRAAPLPKREEALRSTVPDGKEATREVRNKTNSKLKANSRKDSRDILEETTLAENTDSKEDARPILALRVKVSHTLDDRSVPGVNALKYKSRWPLPQTPAGTNKENSSHHEPPAVDKSWKLKYELKQYPQARARALFAAAKAKRRAKFESLKEVDEGLQRIRNELGQFSEKGRAAQQEEAEFFEAAPVKEVP